MHDNEFGTDTSRLRVLGAYNNLEQTKWEPTYGTYSTRLQKTKQRNVDLYDSTNAQLISNGKGFFFTKVDSNGQAIKNSFDFGFEVWDVSKRSMNKLPQLLEDWCYSYHPMPFYSECKNDHLIVYYSRSSKDYKLLLEIFAHFI